jgi:hypothetical protein
MKTIIEGGYGATAAALAKGRGVLSVFVMAYLAAAISGCGTNSGSGEDVASQSDALITTTGGAFYDTGTQCTVGGTTMHCCPNGYAMIGARVDQNVFKCAPLQFPSGTRSLDTSTQRAGMHACPYGQVMVGFHNGLNRLACQTLPGTMVNGEYTDPVPPPLFPNTPTQDTYPMHVCSPSQGYTMSGINVGQNKFLCASDYVIP